MAAKTVFTYPLTGQRDFPVAFEYLARKFVQVSLKGAAGSRLLALNTDYRFSAKNQITTVQSLSPDGQYDTIEIRRYTSATERLVDFNDGSILRAYDLNISQIQTLHVAEEARDLTADTIGVNGDGNLDARNRRIVNVANGVDALDAINVSQLRDAEGVVQGAANAAAASAAEAAGYRDQAKGWSDTAHTHADASYNSSLAAKTSETIAVAAASTAVAASLESEDSAKDSKDEADRAAAQVVLAAIEVGKAADEVVKASNEADRAKTEADRAQGYTLLTGVDAQEAKKEADRAKAEADRAAEAAGTAIDPLLAIALPVPRLWVADGLSTRLVAGHNQTVRAIPYGSDFIRMPVHDMMSERTMGDPNSGYVISFKTRDNDPDPWADGWSLSFRQKNALSSSNPNGTAIDLFESNDNQMQIYFSAYKLKIRHGAFIDYSAVTGGQITDVMVAVTFTKTRLTVCIDGVFEYYDVKGDWKEYSKFYRLQCSNNRINTMLDLRIWDKPLTEAQLKSLK